MTMKMNKKFMAAYFGLPVLEVLMVQYLGLGALTYAINAVIAYELYKHS